MPNAKGVKTASAIALIVLGVSRSAFGIRHVALPELGAIDFPTSAESPEAQQHFLRGVAWLHNFGYEEAIDEFQAAQRIEPGFAMAYWGEAMARDQPVWFTEDLPAARLALARLARSPAVRAARAPTVREQAYLAAVDVLFGEGTKDQRDGAYAEAMRRVSERFPRDHEAAVFYALALLGTVPYGGYDLETRERAGAIASAVFRANPRHPGAAHVLIHANDDREHAHLALPAARAYARIAPTSSHALHMPAHIFLQLGYWDEAVASDEASFAASESRVKRRNLPITHRDYHSLSWLEYEYLQQGRYDAARATWKPIEEAVRFAQAAASEKKSGPAGEHAHSGGGPDAMSLRNDLATMRAFFVLETRRWDLMKGSSRFDNVDELFAVGMSAARLGDVERAQAALELFQKFAREERDPSRQKLVAIMEAELAALLHLHRGDRAAMIASMERATAIENAVSRPVGRPHPVKPSHELYGELLLEIGRPNDAAAQFDRALWRGANRALATLGLARARAATGDKAGARESYKRLLQIWAHADPSPELEEARRGVQ